VKTEAGTLRKKGRGAEKGSHTGVLVKREIFIGGPEQGGASRLCEKGEEAAEGENLGGGGEFSFLFAHAPEGKKDAPQRGR